MTDRQTLLFAGLVVLLLVGIAVTQALIPPSLHGSVIEPPQPMPDFSLQSGSGEVRLSGFRGKIVLLFFGYTSCPDICPVTLANLRQALMDLGEEKAAQVQVVYVSVDWKRDTPEKVSAYVGGFRPDFVGLTGGQAQIEELTRAYGIYYKFNEPDPENGFFTVDHSASTLVLDRSGNLVMTLPYGLTPAELTEDLQVLVRRKP